jgi:YD repeat-containing protein
LNRLTQKTYPDSTTVNYTYDLDSPLTQVRDPTGTHQFTFYNNGNTQTKVVGSNTTSYAWDFENRMTSVTLPGSGGTVAFKYDPFGRRIYKSSLSVAPKTPFKKLNQLSLAELFQ